MTVAPCLWVLGIGAGLVLVFLLAWTWLCATASIAARFFDEGP